MDTPSLINKALAAEMDLGEVASVLTRLEQGQWGARIDGELNIVGAVARLYDEPRAEVPFTSLFDRRSDGTLRHGRYDETELDVLAEVQSSLDHAGLRARINHVLHWMRPDHLRARAAVEQYMAFAEVQEDRVNSGPHDGTVAWGHAANLSKRLGKNDPLHSNVLDGIEAALARHEGDDQQGQYSNRLMELLFTYRRGDPLRYAVLVETLAGRAEAGGNRPMASRHWNMAARWYHRADDTAQETAARIQAAEMLVADALEKDRAGMNAHLVSHDLTRALTALRESGAPAARIEEVHRLLRAIQRTPPEGMHELVVDLDQEVVEQLRRVGQMAVAGKTFPEVLSGLALLMTMIPRPELTRQVQHQLDTTVAWRLATYSIQDREGRTQPAPQTEAEHLEHGIYRQQDICRFLIGLQLEVAVAQIRSEKSVTAEHLETLVNDHPLVPAGHGASVLRGLVAGLEDDFLSAVPILIPQIEAILRHVLTTRGVVTSGLDSKGVQQENNMIAFLTEEPHLKILDTVFGETLLFDLRGLLVEKSGKNLRNLMAHGLATDNEIAGATGRYVWSLAVQLLMTPEHENGKAGEMTELSEDSRK